MSETRKQQYPFSVEVAMQHFTDEAFMRQKFVALGHEDITVQPAQKDGDTVITTSTRSVPVDVPSFAKKFISPMSKVSEKDVYEPSGDGYEGTWRIELKGAPVVASGTISLKPTADGKGSEHILTVNLEVKVPMVGKKIASSLIGDTLKNVEDDLNYNATHIKG